MSSFYNAKISLECDAERYNGKKGFGKKLGKRGLIKRQTVKREIGNREKRKITKKSKTR